MKKVNNRVMPAPLSPTASQQSCTSEAKICPDGSAVGRGGPHCDFAPCPTQTQIISATPSSVSHVSIDSFHWKNYTCKYGGYSLSIPDEVGVSMFAGLMGEDHECPVDINGGIRVYTHTEDLLNISENRVKEMKTIRVDGIDGIYAKVEQIENGKISRHLLMYQFKRSQYLYLILDLDYKDPIRALDFYKDTNWDTMLDAYTNTQSNNSTQIPIVNVFDNMAKTLKFSQPIPRPTQNFEFPVAGKPVIYLYPEKETEINVNIQYAPGFAVTYPLYRSGWDVIAEPNGKLTNIYDGKEYSYLFWEGNPDPNAQYDLSTGFVVKGEDTASFLQETLRKMGLTPKEYNEFIVYWYPKMKDSTYNLIHFASRFEYDDNVQMKISPQPDSILRVFMVYKSLAESRDIQSQAIAPFQRHGFSVVEWGGSELPN